MVYAQITVDTVRDAWKLRESLLYAERAEGRVEWSLWIEGECYGVVMTPPWWRRERRANRQAKGLKMAPERRGEYCDIPYARNAHEIDLGRGWADENVNSIHKRFDAQVQCTSIKASRWTRTWKVQYTSAKNADAYRTNWMQFEFTKSKSKCSSSFDMKAENAEGSILNAQVYKLISNRTVISEWKKLWRIVDVEKWKRRVGIKRKSIGQT